MSARDFLRRQLTAADKAKLIALPSNAALLTALGQKQTADASLTTLSGKTIGAKGLDLLASSTSAVAINALGGSGGLIVSGMVASLDAGKLTGSISADLLVDGGANKTFTVAEKSKLSALPDNSSLSVTLNSKVAAAEKGAANGVATLDGGGKVPAAQLPTTDAVLEGGTNLYFGAARVRDVLLSGFSTATNTAVTVSDSVLSALGKLQAQTNTRLQVDADQSLNSTQQAQGRSNLALVAVASTGLMADVGGVISDTQTPSQLRRSALLISDWNTAIYNGFFRSASSAVNGPSTTSTMYGVTIAADALSGIQLVWLAGSGNVKYEREYYNSGGITFTAWREVRNTADVLDVNYVQIAGPAADLGQSIGATARRYANLFSRLVTVGGNGDTGAQLILNGAAASTRIFRIQTDGVMRWAVNADNAAETGSNAGSSFVIGAYSDAGAYLGSAITIARATRVASFTIRPTVVGAGAIETQDNKGAANGYAGLGADGLVPSSQLPASGSYKGSWNASTNTPTITAGVGANGDEYTVSVAGTNSITGTSVAWSVGDRAKFTTSGNKWERIPNTNAVSSVAGKVGAVTLAISDIASLQTSLDQKVASSSLATVAISGSSEDLTEGATKLLLTAAERAKVAGVASGATANSTDAYLLSRANHSGAQEISTVTGLQTAIDLLAPLASPALTGSPTAPTPAIDNTSTIVATTAFVVGQAASTTPAANGTAAVGTSKRYARADHVHATDVTRAPLASPALTGAPTAPTPAADDTSTLVATTAFVIGQAASTTPVVNGTAAVGTSKKYARADHVHATDTTRAPLASPSLTGIPTAPTAALGTNTTQIATMAALKAGLDASNFDTLDGGAI